MNSQLKISIPKPCAQSWEEMIPVEGGNYCEQCNKVVIDFTAMNTIEFQHWFNNAGANVCGRFLHGQLDYPESLPSKNWKRNGIKLLLAASLTFVGFIRADAKEVETAQHIQKLDPDFKPMQVKDLEIFRINTDVIIKGKVTDSVTKFPIQEVTIVIKGRLEKAVTDVKGNFIIHLEIGENQEVTLIFSHQRFNIKEIKIKGSQTFPVVVKASPATITRHELLGAMVSIKPEDITKKKSFFEKLCDWIKKQFE
jgi:hypothetical protein